VIQRLLVGEQASHVCHNSICIDPDHIVVEPKSSIEARKGCEKLTSTVLAELMVESIICLPMANAIALVRNAYL